MQPGPWQNRSKRLESGKVVRFRQRDLGNGELEIVYLNNETRTTDPQPAATRTT